MKHNKGTGGMTIRIGVRTHRHHTTGECPTCGYRMAGHPIYLALWFKRHFIACHNLQGTAHVNLVEKV